MSTGSIQTTPKAGVYWKENHALEKPFYNGAGVKINNGQEVTLQNDGTVKLRVSGAEIPLGYVSVGNVDGKLCTISTNIHATVFAVAKGGAIVPGQELVPDGTTDANGLYGYAAAAAGNFVNAIALSGGDAGDEIHVALLRFAYVKPA